MTIPISKGNEDTHHGMIQQIKSYVSKAAELYDLPGFAVSIRASADAPAPLAGLHCMEVTGYADIETKRLLQPDTVFHMASLAKTFTSTCLLSLCNAGQLALGDRLSGILPGFQMDDERAALITLSQVLHHTAGIPDIEDYHWQSPEIGADTLRHYACSDEIKTLKLLHDPGTCFQYSNIGYDILGAAIETVCGKPFEYAVAERIFEPLGMADTTFLTLLRSHCGRQLFEAHQDSASAGKNPDLQTHTKKKDAPKQCGQPAGYHAITQAIMDAPRLAMPHRKDKNKHIEKQPYYPYNRMHAPSSTLTSTLGDMAKWGECHLSGFREIMQVKAIPASHPGTDGANNASHIDEGSAEREFHANAGDARDIHLLSPAMYSAILAGDTLVPNNGEHMGLGWFKREQQGYLLLGHEGSDDGFRSSFWLSPDLGIQILVCANIDRAPAKKINKELFSLLVDYCSSG